MKKLVRRQELLNLEKTWLLSLSSHYLRTPLTIIQSGQEMLKEGSDKAKLVAGMSSLNTVVSRVVDNLRNDSVVAEMKAPEKKRYKHASFWQPKVIVPVFITLGLVIALNIVFTAGADLYPGTANIISQVCMIAVGAGLLYVMYDSWSERQALEKYQKQLLVYEEGLDRVRNNFVLSMANELMPEIKKAKSFVIVKTPLYARKNIKKGLKQLEKTTEKFLLICQLEREELKKQAAELGLKGTIEKAREQSKHPKSPVSLLLSNESTLSQPEHLAAKTTRQ
jgi:signal transduction histidine kinase